MPKVIKKALDGLDDLKDNALDVIDDVPGVDKAKRVGDFLADKAGDVKDSAMDLKEDLEDKLNELDDMLKDSINEYNDAYTLMNDKGMQLFIDRCRAVDVIKLSEALINSIANHPKAFDTDFEQIKREREQFTDSCTFAMKELDAAREAASGAGAGAAAGASVAFMAPTAAMWVATTFGTASTGTAISTLSGAAATNAALAWLGGGALASGGGGMVAGEALLALAGPIGWSIAGATLLTSIILFAKKRTKLNKQKNEEIESVKKNTEIVKEIDAKISSILTQTTKIRDGLSDMCISCMTMFGKDYLEFSDDQKQSLGALVNNTKALSAMFEKNVE